MSAPPEGLEPAEAYFRKLATPPPDAELRKLGRREHKKPSHSHLRLRLQGGGSAEQRDYVEEEVVQTANIVKLHIAICKKAPPRLVPVDSE